MNVSKRHPGPFAAVGLIAAFAFAVLIVVAINGDSAWVYGENTLSDLGISDVQLSADLFNYGCMAVGILLFICMIGKAVCETGYNRASGCMMAISAIFLILVGYVTKDFGNGNTHFTIAILLFLFAFVAMALSTVGDWKDDRKLFSAISTILVLIVIGCAVGMNMESLEVITVGCMILWMFTMCAKMIVPSKG